MLTACNMVITPEPMFTGADAEEAPQCAPVYGASPAGGRPFDTAAPATSWPDCADWGVVREGHVLAWREAGEWRTEPLLIAAGPPLIVRFRVAKEGDPPVYCYVIFAPTARDAQQRVTTFTITQVLYGPQDRPPHGRAAGRRHAPAVPGHAMDGSNCRPPRSRPSHPGA